MRAVALIFLFLPGLALAQSTASRPGDPVLDALRIGEVARILHDEAVQSAEGLAEGLVDPARHAAWADMVSRINAPPRLERELRDAFDAALDPAAAGDITAFLGSALGERIVGLEISAREVLSNPGVEEAAAERFAEASEAGTPRAAQVTAFIDANDLIDSNVVGALNANAAFLEGMRSIAESGALPGFVPGGDIRAQVWGQEPAIREDTESWVTAFVSLAYDPLPEEDFASYITFSESDAGQALNGALFDAFDRVFVLTARETGAALAGMMTSEDL